MTHYSAAIGACAHGKWWRQALELLADCKMWASVDTISYNAAISACEKTVKCCAVKKFL